MIEFTINLPSEGHARQLVDDLRKSYWLGTADQIEAQIQPPVPAEPTGDVLLVDQEGRVWHRDEGGWCSNDRFGPIDGENAQSWAGLYEFGIEKVYRREPSPEAVEALATEYAWGDARPATLRKFAARLLGHEGPRWVDLFGIDPDYTEDEDTAAPLNVYKSGPPGPAVQQPEQFSAPKPAPLGLALYPTEASVPLEKVRQVLRSSPTGYLTNEETLTAYRDLRKRLAALLPEGAQ